MGERTGRRARSVLSGWSGRVDGALASAAVVSGFKSRRWSEARPLRAGKTRRLRQRRAARAGGGAEWEDRGRRRAGDGRWEGHHAVFEEGGRRRDHQYQTDHDRVPRRGGVSKCVLLIKK